jgi:hypothetical protein
MATVLEKYNTEKPCCAFFVKKKWLNTKDIYKEIIPVCGAKCLSCEAVHNWIEKFSQERSNFADNAS